MRGPSWMVTVLLAARALALPVSDRLARDTNQEYSMDMLLQMINDRDKGWDHSRERRGEELCTSQELVTVPPMPGQIPLVVVLPPPLPKSEDCGMLRYQAQCTTTCPMVPYDSPVLMECCPVDFEPRFPGAPASTSPRNRPTVRVYSSKWMGKRQVRSVICLKPSRKRLYPGCLAPCRISISTCLNKPGAL